MSGTNSWRIEYYSFTLRHLKIKSHLLYVYGLLELDLLLMLPAFNENFIDKIL
jgi:hypothetical protein